MRGSMCTVVPYKLRYSMRVKRLRIQVVPRGVIAIARHGTAVDDIERAILRHKDFIVEKQKYYQTVESTMIPASYKDCSQLPVLGKNVVLPQDLLDAENRERLVVKWLDTRLMEFLEEKLKKYAKKELAAAKLRLRSPITLWGSCGNSGIMINRKLVHAPAEVTEYVLVHELVHLVHRNHSSRFWGEVEHLLGDVRAHRKWLNLQGAFLMNGEVPIIH